jgi:hypothetical protein
VHNKRKKNTQKRLHSSHSAKTLLCSSLSPVCVEFRWPSSVEFWSPSSCLLAIVDPSRPTRLCEPGSQGDGLWGRSALIVGIKNVISRRNSCIIHKAGRDQNEAAHKLAQHALHTRNSKASFSFVPSCIQDLVYNDRLRCQSPGDLT